MIWICRRIARLGEYDLSTMNDGANPIDFAIAKTIVHEQYEPDIILNDIAIVKLKRQAPVNSKYLNYFELLSFGCAVSRKIH